LYQQLTNIGAGQNEHAAKKVLSHAGRGPHAWFEIEWLSGDRTWLPFRDVAHLTAIDSYLENQGVDSINNLIYGSGRPPDEVIDQVNFPQQILRDKEQGMTLDSVNVMAHTCYKEMMDCSYNVCQEQTMSSPINNNMLMQYYKYLTLLSEAALTSGHHPGAVPNGYELWATAHGYARDIYDARGKIATAPRFFGTYKDANGNMQWTAQGSHAPGGVMHNSTAPHGHYLYQNPAPSGLMTTDEHFSMMEKYRDYERRLLRMTTHRLRVIVPGLRLNSMGTLADVTNRGFGACTDHMRTPDLPGRIHS
jgi:hypothetical protein